MTWVKQKKWDGAQGLFIYKKMMFSNESGITAALQMSIWGKRIVI